MSGQPLVYPRLLWSIWRSQDAWLVSWAGEAARWYLSNDNWYTRGHLKYRFGKGYVEGNPVYGHVKWVSPGFENYHFKPIGISHWQWYGWPTLIYDPVWEDTKNWEFARYNCLDGLFHEAFLVGLARDFPYFAPDMVL